MRVVRPGGNCEDAHVTSDLLPVGLLRESVIVVDLDGVVIELRGATLPLPLGANLIDEAENPREMRETLDCASGSSVPVPVRLRLRGVSAPGRAQRVEGERPHIAIAVDTGGSAAFLALDHRVHLLSEALQEREVAISALATANQDLERSRGLYQSLVDPSPNAIVLLDDEMRIVGHNPAAEALYGMKDGEEGNGPEILGADVVAGILEAATVRRPVTIRGVEHRSSAHFARWFDVQISPIPVGGIHVVSADVSHRVVFERRLTMLATTDPLTGLGNRARLDDRIAQALGDLRRRPGGVAVVAMDIDHFKLVNDAHGHAAGDLMLIRVARRIQSILRGVDTVCRVGGDEFVAVLRGVDTTGDAARAIERIHRHVIDLDELAAASAPSLSVGYTWVDNPDMGVGDVLSQADAALYESKRRGRNRVTHYEALNGLGPFLSSGELLTALHRAVDEAQFELAYQPIVEPGGRSQAVEALIRWRHPKLGVLMPGVFVDKLIESGLISTVGQWVLEKACADLATWHSLQGVPPHLAVQVNVAPSQIVDPNTTAIVESALGRAGLDPGRLCLEMTEQALSIAPMSASTLKDVGDLGVTLALDDFGTGTSSLAHLRDPWVGQIKIDRSFVAAIGVEQRTERITSGLIALSSELGIAVVAEGVETEMQMSWLVDRGCPLIQGFLLSRPVDASTVPGRLAALAV